MTAEGDVKKACLDLVLRCTDLVKLWRCQSGVAKVRGGRMHLAPAGTADLVGVLRGGVFLGVEVKKDAKKSSTHVETRERQAKWAEEIRALGGVVWQVSSASELHSLLEAYRRTQESKGR